MFFKPEKLKTLDLGKNASYVLLISGKTENAEVSTHCYAEKGQWGLWM